MRARLDTYFKQFMGDTKDTVKGGIWVDLYVKVSIDIALRSTDKDDYVNDRFSAKA